MCWRRKKTDDAVIRLAKDIVSVAGVDFEVLTKSLDPFKLVGRINQHHSNGYDISIDVNNGVFLDDFYYIMENYEKDGVDLARKMVFCLLIDQQKIKIII